MTDELDRRVKLWTRERVEGVKLDTGKDGTHGSEDGGKRWIDGEERTEEKT